MSVAARNGVCSQERGCKTCRRSAGHFFGSRRGVRVCGCAKLAGAAQVIRGIRRRAWSSSPRSGGSGRQTARGHGGGIDFALVPWVSALVAARSGPYPLCVSPARTTAQAPPAERRIPPRRPMSQSTIELRPGLADVPVAESGVSFIDGKRARLEYRGIAVETLAKESSFEETAYLLLRGELPTQKQLADFDDQLRHHRRIKYKLKDLIKCLPETGHPMYALQSAVAAMGMFYPARDVTNEQSNWESVIRLIAKMPPCVAAFHRPRNGDEPIPPRDDLDHAGNFYYMLFEKEASPAVRKVIDACLILHAEHTMNASTFSARVTGSTLANPYTVIASAIGTLTGPLHGGANEEVLTVLDEIGSPEKVRGWLQGHLKADPKFRIMG